MSKVEEAGVAALRVFLAGRPGNQTDLAEIASHFRVTPLQAWILCNLAAGEGWVAFHCSEKAVMYVP